MLTSPASASLQMTSLAQIAARNKITEDELSAKMLAAERHVAKSRLELEHLQSKRTACAAAATALQLIQSPLAASVQA